MNGFYVLIGGMFGYVLPYVDYLLHTLWLKADSPDHQRVREAVHHRSVRETWKSLRLLHGSEARYVHRSAMFHGVFLALTVFVLTSTGSVFAMGMVFGFGLRIMIALLGLLRGLEQIRPAYFWDISTSVPDRMIRRYIVLYLMAIVVLVSLTFFR